VELALFQRFADASRVIPWDSEETIRAELFSIERLEQHGRSLAAAQPVAHRTIAVRRLHARLRANAKILLASHRAIAAAVASGGAITPSAEWLLDNHHIVEEQIREIFVDLPATYYRQLPKLATGPFAGYPRIFGVAWAFVAHTDSHFDAEALRRFLRAYQSVQALTIGELWAVAITLRIVLVENLRRAARRIEMSRAGRVAADALADQVIEAARTDGSANIRAELARLERAPLAAAFAVQLVHRLRDQAPGAGRVMRWLEERLAAQDTNVDRVVQEEHQSQGGTNVTVRNIITSMRRISNVDWADIVESVSLVDIALRSASRFAEMDFATRNLYRDAIEELARGAGKTELEITQAAIETTRAAPPEAPEHDPGYCLIGAGRRAFEAHVEFRVPFEAWPRRFNDALGMPGLVAMALVLAAVVLSIPLLAMDAAAWANRWYVAALVILGSLPALDVAIALVNAAVTQEMDAAPLPGLDLKRGIPETLRTLVVVPMLLSDRRTVDELVDRLEVHFLASTEGDLYFALLSDWTDAATEVVDGDDALLEAAAAGIASLNARYAAGDAGDRFMLLHRRRIWNEGQQRWMGWERKRGKLHELNRLLRGDPDTTFIAVDGKPPRVPRDVRYVITLDSDTRMPLECAQRLIGKMAHPLNQPRFDAVRRRVVDGYGVLQPRVIPALPLGQHASPFQQAFSNASGIDPYAFAVSDVYQDLFGEGSYIGKGIYDVDAFEASLSGRVPENAVLSHDLFEGTFARAGFVSDIELVEEFPSRYDSAAARQHRWVRGDWQLLPWLLRREGAGAIGRQAARLPRIGRWKMIDNLRRSLVAPATIAALAIGWTLPLRAAAIWTAFVLATNALPMLLPTLAGIPKRPEVEWRGHLRAIAADFRLATDRIGLLLALLAHQAWLMCDAILRTLFRLFVSHRHLLDWITAAQARQAPTPSLMDSYVSMRGALYVTIIVATAVMTVHQSGALIAAPFILVWLISPLIARRISRAPVAIGEERLSTTDARSLRRVARRTWRFFETFVTEQDNWLPPDNFQAVPEPIVASRTSPTNIGLYLLAAATARDFGWLGTLDLLDRVERTLATMERLYRVHGHYLNWYDTRTLARLEPQYISTVDSGNLAGHLITLANACSEWNAIAADESVFGGIDDALAIADESLREFRSEESQRSLEGVIDALRTELRATAQASGDPDGRLDAFAERLAHAADAVRASLDEEPEADSADTLFWLDAAAQTLASHRRDRTELRERAAAEPESRADDPLQLRLHAVEARARAIAYAMDFEFLLDRERNLLSIGYSVTDGQLDSSCYDLLASEARLASFIAIAKRDVPSRHWFRLGRNVTSVDGGAALISWSGSMFEYLMPSLVMRAPIGSLLENTSRLVVRRQIDFATRLDIPWGISESAYNVRDLAMTYQYSSFGVPGLGFKRGLGENLVIAPYATALAAMVDPPAAARNLARLAEIGALGRYGYYEALDFTPVRTPEGHGVAIVYAFMAHHQGMTIVALADALLNGEMRRRFHAEPLMHATELLLQERRPRDVIAAYPRAERVSASEATRDLNLPAPRRIRSPHTPAPETQLLSNGRYTVMLSAAGSGYSGCNDVAVTRWREDPTRDPWGSYIYVRDLDRGRIWSAGYQPTATEPDWYEVTFTEGRATIARRDDDVLTTLDVVVSSEEDAEVRRVTIASTSKSQRHIELTSYSEVVLAPQAADVAHPAFSKMFVHTEFDERSGALLATRTRRAPDDPELWAAHFAVVEGRTSHAPQFETDRARFVGRGRDVRRPAALADSTPLSGTVGAVLDPVFALRHRIRVPPEKSAHVAFWTVVANTRDAVMDLVDKHLDANAFDRAATLAWTQAQVQLNHLRIRSNEAALLQGLAARLLYADASLRASADAIGRGAAAPPALWSQGISGDLPIMLLRIDAVDDLPVVRQALHAHEYWRMKHLAVDLVILNERGASYVQDLQIALEAVVRTTHARPRIVGGAMREGGVFVLRSDLISSETRGLLFAMARVTLHARRGTLHDQLASRETRTVAPPPVRVGDPAARAPSTQAPQRGGLESFNGLGGFAQDGREYVTEIVAGALPPAPWINVVANSAFGFQVSSEGSGYTWAQNSKENQLTAWSNDPVGDPSGEVLYVRDEESGDVWGPTALPCSQQSGRFVARHGFGYSRFEHTSRGIDLDLLQFVPVDDPVKISVLTVRNASGRARRLSVTAYTEWTLGPSRHASLLSVVTELDAPTGGLFARNPWNRGFGSAVAFADLGGRQIGWTADRREFIGRHGSPEYPSALASDAPLSGSVGAGLDACAALQTTFDLAAGETTRVIALLGQATSDAHARALIARYRGAEPARVLAAVTNQWDATLGCIRVQTPDRSMDLLLNGWALYQTLACRVWARAGFYQASGAFGFRDQLQDGMALAHSRPDLTREHLLRAASRQFREGDVQHWWLPHSGDGVRTRISDDRAWLVHAVVHYMAVTSDVAVLDEIVPFLDGPPLADGVADAYFQPQSADEAATLFEHCARGLDQSLAVGPHGLPLIGAGDWNDGMNRVGPDGNGESVWLGWMLHSVLNAFAPYAAARGCDDRARRWDAFARALKDALERAGWDSSWYRRAYFDDGTPLGSASNGACRIDSIAQSWAVMSGAADPARAKAAMEAVDRWLVRRRDGLVLLFTPPFDASSSPDPGYIRSYPPGIRENGGQYTHAAAWVVIANALLGRGDTAVELFSYANPIARTRTREDVAAYKVEPYAVAADIYSEPPHTGRGGWTWYTGSAGWLYRAGVEYILGIRVRGQVLSLAPCIPRLWEGYRVDLRYRSARYRISVDNRAQVGSGIAALSVDGHPLENDGTIELVDDGQDHRVDVVLGQRVNESDDLSSRSPNA
jgi:cyclic beta-1,2-glucan synthetase